MPKEPAQRSVPSEKVAEPTRAPAKEPNQFQFAIVSDRTGGHRGTVFESALDKANLMMPDFVMSVGDLIEGYTTDPAEIAEQWQEFRGFVTKLDMPFFFVPGNHDLSNPVMAAAWKEQFGPSYYHFVYRNVLFLCLNTEDVAPSHISDAQIEYMRRALAENPKVRWTLLFMHKPLWNESEHPEGRAAFERIEALLADRAYTVFAGHFHNYKKSLRRDRRYIVLATTGGGSELKGPLFGQFDELAWVTMTDSGPRLANLMLEGILDEDVRTEASAKRVDAASSGLRVSVDSLHPNTERFAGGRTTLRVHNQTASSVRFDAQVGLSAPIEPSPHRIEPTTVLSGQKLEIPIQLRVAKPALLATIPGIPINYSAQVLDGDPFVLRDVVSFGLSQSRTIAARARPVVVDGKLDEWGKLTLSPDGRYHHDTPDYPATRPAAENLSYAFDLAYDADAVYVAVQVRDDVVIADADKRPWKQDGVELELDVRDDPARSANRRLYWDAWKTYAYMAVSPPDEKGAVSLFESEKIPKSVRVVCVRTAGGYAAEIAIPNAVLNATRPSGEWRTLRFALGVHDHDVVDGPRTAIWWQPDWRWDNNIPGSGTFESSRRN
ncbi:MAG: sugar-binding protein [Polyangiaceae bacterium]